jgi:hypothetical protein
MFYRLYLQHYPSYVLNLVPRYDKCLSVGGDYVENRQRDVEFDKNKMLYIKCFTATRYFLDAPRSYLARQNLPTFYGTRRFIAM